MLCTFCAVTFGVKIEQKEKNYSQFVGQGLRAVTTGISGSSRRRKIGKKVLKNALFLFFRKKCDISGW